jgi:phosphoserine aminotransferase
MIMPERIFNFNAGPATLPLEVIETAKSELTNFRNTGMSILEISHRSPEYDKIHMDAMANMLDLMGLDDSYKTLFLGAGASGQFAMIPMNFLHEGETAAYVDTGSWSAKAIKEAKKVGAVHVAASAKDKDYTCVPKAAEMDIPGNAAYVHVTSNNTIFGTQLHEFPDGKVPLICDMSSDILSRRLDFSRFSMIYAGAQKNLGPAGVVAVVIRKSLLERCREDAPIIFNYKTHAEKDSLFNTPPAFSIYIVNLVLEWIKKQGGLDQVEKNNCGKKERIYQLMDLYPDYYRGTVEPDSRSWMNLTMRLPTEDLEKKFIAEAKAAGLGGLKGHRSVGGVRASMYNAMPMEGAERLADFMEEFKKAN